MPPNTSVPIHKAAKAIVRIQEKAETENVRQKRSQKTDKQYVQRMQEALENQLPNTGRRESGEKAIDEQASPPIYVY